MIMANYWNDFHRKNSEQAMESLRKQRLFSPEEMEAQTKAIHQKIAEQEQQNKNNE